MLDHFNLLDPELAAVQIRVTDVLTVLREGHAGGRGRTAPGEPLALPNRAAAGRGNGNRADAISHRWSQRGAELNAASQQRFAAAQNDFAATRASAARSGARRSSGWPSAKRPRKSEIDPDLLSVERLDERVAAAQDRNIETLGQRMAAAWARAGRS